MRSINLSRRSFLSGAAAASALGVMALSGCAPQAEPAKEVAETGTAPKEVVETIDTDLLIVGLGGSGLACAVQAALDDTNCLVIEKNAESGGNALGVEGMFAINSSMQKAAGIEEITPAEVIAAQMEMLQYRPNGAEWVEFCESSAANIDWCLEQGVEYNGTVDNYYTGLLHTFHWFKEGSCSKGYVPQMTKRAEELGVEVRYNTTANELILDDSGAVCGLYAIGQDGEILINAKAVILATGGFCGNPDIIKRQGWNTDDMVCLGLNGTGDGFNMATAVGAIDDLANASQSICPTIPAFPVTDYKADPYNPINGLGGIATGGPIMWVNETGDRFVREDTTSVMAPSSASIATKRNAATYCVFDQNIYDTFFGTTPEAQAMFEESITSDNGYSLYSSNDLADLAQHFDMDPENFKNAVARYNESCKAGTDKDFLKDPSLLIPVEQPPFYIGRMSYVFYFATGGLKVDKFQRVWDIDKQPIPGLYAIGNEGNNHYASVYTINIPGTAFGHQVNSGRVAAQQAAKYINS